MAVAGATAANKAVGLPELAFETVMGLISILWHAVQTFRKMWSFSMFSPLLGLTALNDRGEESGESQEMSLENPEEYGNRSKRSEERSNTTVATSRYIKGDPLQGYYDFVITEGSYKFWAVFQVNSIQSHFGYWK